MTSRDLLVVLAGTLSLANAQQGPPVNAGAAILQDFEKRVAGYLKAHKALHSRNLHRVPPADWPGDAVRERFADQGKPQE